MHGKERFLTAFDASPLATHAYERPPYISIFFKTGIGVMAALCVAVGVSAYADNANVAATSPLYPLKRLSENVQLALTPTQGKAQLQATFAVRRASEIDALQTSNPTSTLIPQLTSDLDQDISSSLNVVVGVNTNNRDDNFGRNHGDGNGSSSIDTSIGAGQASSGTTAAVVISGATTTENSTSTLASTSISAKASISITSPTSSVNIYCAAFNMSTSGALFGSLEDNLNQHPGALVQFVQQCSDENRGSHYYQSDDASTTASATTTRRGGDRGVQTGTDIHSLGGGL